MRILCVNNLLNRQVAATYLPVIERASEIIARLDVFIAFAHVSLNAPEPYCRPKILPSSAGIIEMKASRHPCVETQDFVDFIPNDVGLKRGESNCQVLGEIIVVTEGIDFLCFRLSRAPTWGERVHTFVR